MVPVLLTVPGVTAAPLLRSPAVLARDLDFGVADAEVSGKSIGAAEGLFLGTQLATHLLLARIMDRIFVARQVVRPREDGVAGLASARVDAVAAMGTSLAVEQGRSHTTADRCGSWANARQSVRLPVSLALVLLEERRCLEAKGATVIRASVGATVCCSRCRTRGHGTPALSRLGRVCRADPRRH